MYEIEGKNIELLEADWDVLIDLDACRYDVFKEVYKEVYRYKGELKRAKTYCSGSEEWRHKNLYGKDLSDVIFLTPRICPFRHVTEADFFMVVRAWKTKWDYRYGTVLPQDMTELTLEQMKQHPKKRFIIHYHQPHAPFVLPEYLDIGELYRPEELLAIFNGEKKSKKKSTLSFVQGGMKRFLGYEFTWKLLIGLGIEPHDYCGKVYKKLGKEGLLQGYVENLKLVLKYANVLIDSFDGKEETLMVVSWVWKIIIFPGCMLNDHREIIKTDRRIINSFKNITIFAL